jgi:hypothetical protein
MRTSVLTEKNDYLPHGAMSRRLRNVWLHCRYDVEDSLRPVDHCVYDSKVPLVSLPVQVQAE